MYHSLSRILPNNHKAMQRISFLVCSRNCAPANLRPRVSRGSRYFWQAAKDACSNPWDFWCGTRFPQCVWAYNLRNCYKTRESNTTCINLSFLWSRSSRVCGVALAWPGLDIPRGGVKIEYKRTKSQLVWTLWSALSDIATAWHPHPTWCTHLLHQQVRFSSCWLCVSREGASAPLNPWRSDFCE